VACLLNTSFAGSTLTTIMVNTHPDVTSIGEGINARIFSSPRRSERYRCTCGVVLSECPYWSAIGQGVRARGLPFDIAGVRLGYTPDSSIERFLVRHLRPRLYHSFHRMTQPIWGGRRRVIDDANVAFIESALEAANARLFFFAGKNLWGHFQLLKMPRLEIKFIRITRDARSFAASYKARGRPFRDAVRVWRKTQEGISAFTSSSIASGCLMTLRYEDLCADPRGELGKVFSFLELDPIDVPDVFYPSRQHITGNHIRHVHELRVTVVERWREVLSEQEVAVVNRSNGPLNREFGYEAR
jgi:hypothetical protein